MAYNIQSVLQNISLFSSLSLQELEYIASFCKIVHYAKKSIIFYENDALHFVFYLLKGEVKLYKIDKYNNEIFLNDLKGGSFIYLPKKISKTKQQHRTFYSVETLKESTMLLIDIEKFTKEFIHKPEILEKILTETYTMMSRYEYIISRDLVFDSTAKVVHMLCTKLEEFNKLKKNDIAYHLHIQPETLSRIIKKLQKAQLIALENKVVTILNKPALEKMYK